jgi:hypothetical protein
MSAAVKCGGANFTDAYLNCSLAVPLCDPIYVDSAWLRRCCQTFGNSPAYLKGNFSSLAATELCNNSTPIRSHSADVNSMSRRTFIRTILGAGAAWGIAPSIVSTRIKDGPFAAMAEILSPPIEQAPTLLTAPIELAGDWGHMLPRSADLVVERMRQACLFGVRLVSDRQPTRLRVDEHTSGPPAVYLHADGSTMAWIMVDIGPQDWSKLAYQFGHELGHVMANSWQPHAKPKSPCQWLEEAMVEAFSVRGLGRLAESWTQNPPFHGDNAFGDSIASYRQNIIRNYTALADQQGLSRDSAKWFTDHRGEIEKPGLNPFAQAFSVSVLDEYERDPSCLEALGALNRWPGRTGIPVDEYLRQWEASCAELQASSLLPTRIRGMLNMA